MHTEDVNEVMRTLMEHLHHKHYVLYIYFVQSSQPWCPVLYYHSETDSEEIKYCQISDKVEILN